MGARGGPRTRPRCGSRLSSQQSLCPPPSQYKLLLLVTLLSRIRHFSSTFASLQCCGLSNPGDARGLGGRPCGNTRRGLP